MPTGTDADGRELWRSSAGLFIRGVGGWGGARGPADSAGRAPQVPTDDRYITTLTYQTHPDQALIYRLSGDRNPLHSDPAFAARAGMDRPILHGLCTFGFAGRAVLALSGADATLRSMSARFAGPVWPGDTLTVDLWRPDDATIGARRSRNSSTARRAATAQAGATILSTTSSTPIVRRQLPSGPTGVSAAGRG